MLKLELWKKCTIPSHARRRLKLCINIFYSIHKLQRSEYNKIIKVRHELITFWHWVAIKNKKKLSESLDSSNWIIKVDEKKYRFVSYSTLFRLRKIFQLSIKHKLLICCSFSQPLDKLCCRRVPHTKVHINLINFIKIKSPSIHRVAVDRTGKLSRSPLWGAQKKSQRIFYINFSMWRRRTTQNLQLMYTPQKSFPPSLGWISRRELWKKSLCGLNVRVPFGFVTVASPF